MNDRGPRKMRIAILHGLIFGTFANDIASIEDYIGAEVLSRIERVLAGKKPKIIGRFTQALPNNWKLYFENVKDSYHASILHLFFTTFEINRLSQKGGIIVSEDGGNHVSYSAIDPELARSAEYVEQNIRSQSEFGLNDPSLLDGNDEFRDGVTLRYCRCSRASCSSRSRTPSRSARSCLARPTAPICTGHIWGRGRQPRTAPRAAEARQSRRPGRLCVDGGRLRRRLRPARHRRCGKP